MQKPEDFERHIGAILRLHLNIEHYLDFLISNYFVCPQTFKTFFLDQALLDKMPFEKKKKVFKSICKEEDLEDGDFKETVRAIEYVQKIRNKAAHEEAFLDPKRGIMLRKLKYKGNAKDYLAVNESLVEEVRKNVSKARKGLTRIYLKLNEKYAI